MKILPIERVPGSVYFHCPGCDSTHIVQTGSDQSPRWGYNGNPASPTFTPSILVSWFQGEERLKKVCHSFVTDGKIQFLGDCTHKLAGQTVDLPELEG